MRRLFALLLLTLVGCFDTSDVNNECRSDENCPVGEVCRVSPIEAGRLICVASCVRDDECAAGEMCSFGRCQPIVQPPADGAVVDAGAVDMAGDAGDAGADAGDMAMDARFPPPDMLVDFGEPDLAAPEQGVEPDLGAVDAEPLDEGAPSIDLDIDDDGGI
ncbi:MAG: Dickkopf N-terminal cysteine-rich domain-containing protein [bacterium]